MAEIWAIKHFHSLYLGRISVCIALSSWVCRGSGSAEHCWCSRRIQRPKLHRAGCETVWRHRHCHQQCERHPLDGYGGDTDEEIRPHAPNQHERHVSRVSSIKGILFHVPTVILTWFYRSKLAAPYLRASKKNPHILNISPPLSMKPIWFKDNVAYTMAKYGMSMVSLWYWQVQGMQLAVPFREFSSILHMHPSRK